MAPDADDTLAYLALSVEGINLAAQVTYAEVEDNDRLIDRAVVVLDDPHGAIADLPREGQAVRVDMGWKSEHAVLFEGAITRVVTEAFGVEARRVTLVAFDPSYQLMQGVPVTKDHTGAVSSIVKAIVGKYPLPIGQIELDPDPTIPATAPLRQTNKRDWVFIQDLAARFAARAFVEYNDGAAKFYFVAESRLLQGDKMGALTYSGGPGQLVEFRYQRVAASASPLPAATAVDPATGDPVDSPAPAPPAPEEPPAPDSVHNAVLDGLGGGLGDDYTSAIAVTAKAKATPDRQRPQTFVRGLPSDPVLAAQAAIQDPTRAFGLHGEGLAVGTIHLRAKGKVGIAGVANWAEGDWYVRQAHHIISESNYWTRFIVTR